MALIGKFTSAQYSAWLGFNETLFQSEFGCVRIRINKKMLRKKWRELQKRASFKWN